ncbi:MAG: DEAD/DEAH box helicase family protein [Lachnospiraceae bacterium]|nr:DEAD/DEAH box helicase family protein [Lachnospiraceae bacterium]
MDTKKLVGKRVMNTSTRAIGTIAYIREGIVAVNCHGDINKYSYPSAFAGLLELEDEKLQEEIRDAGIGASFENFKREYRYAIKNEIDFLKATGGKKNKIIDGEKLPSKSDEYLYAFDTDTDLHFPDGTAIKLWFPDNIVPGYVVSCEDFTIIIRTMEYLGESIESVEFTSEQWQLLEALIERLEEMEPSAGSLAYEIACNGKKQITEWQSIKCGQNYAFNRATSEGITFIWGPPGTGKTETLANIALEHIENGRRVLMLSYSNVSVDGALLRVAKKADLPEGMVIRYGYPRTKELLDSKTLTSYQYVLHKNPEKAAEYQELNERKKKLKRKDPERIEVNKKLNKIRDYLLEEEKTLIHRSAFVATTVSKATVDKAIYTQRFDVVIFDEASMAYVPQIVFSAGIARDYFVCLGDFCQLPAIVQNNAEMRLTRDIFEHTGITSAVEKNQGHEWLVMLDLQYRMHQDIADFVSEHMYQGLLKTSERIAESRNEIAACHPCPDAAMSLIDLSGMYSVCTKTMDGSRINIMSAIMCLRLAEKNISQYEVGIITPYSAQSRLILAMIRDIQEHDKRWLKVSCATVHQFQGSEKPVIIYDAVDCFRMPYPGMLLTSLKNDTANRLFNVALTRAKGKFILVANIGFLERKNISKKLIFTKAMNLIRKEKHDVRGNYVLDEMMPLETEKPIVYVEDRKTSWELFISDIKSAKNMVHIDVPDVIEDNDKAIAELAEILENKKAEALEICIRIPEEVDVPEGLKKYTREFGYVTNPVTIIDKKIVWFGQPLYAADFISEGDILDTEYFPCMRFIGPHTARSIQAFLEM